VETFFSFSHLPQNNNANKTTTMTWMTELGLAVVVGVPLSYVVSKVCAQIFQRAYVVALWTIFLSIPYRSHDDLPIHSATTMMIAVVTFTFPLKLTQLILYPDYGDKKKKKDDGDDNKKKKDDDGDGEKTTTTTTTTTKLSWTGLLRFTGSFVYYLFPISKVEESKRLDKIQIVQLVVENVVVALCKTMALPFLGTAILYYSESEPDYTSRSWLTYYKLSVLFFMQVVAGTWTLDLQFATVCLVSGGYYEGLPFNEYVFLSTSLEDFWGRRYNRLINTLLKDTVYKPLLILPNKGEGVTKNMASLLVFLVSGVLHSHVAYFAFGRGAATACLFFVVQHFMIRFERKFVPSTWPKIIRGVFAFSLLMCSFHLYLGLFVDAMPDWEKQNPNQVPFELAYRLSDYLATKLLY
jgi:hypothetical protein